MEGVDRGEGITRGRELKGKGGKKVGRKGGGGGRRGGGEKEEILAHQTLAVESRCGTSTKLVLGSSKEKDTAPSVIIEEIARDRNRGADPQTPRRPRGTGRG